MLVFMRFVSCLRRTRRCGDEHEVKLMDAMIVKSGEFLFRDLGLSQKSLQKTREVISWEIRGKKALQ